MLAGFLEHGRLLKAADGVLEIGFAAQDSFFLETAREAQNIALPADGGPGAARRAHRGPPRDDRRGGRGAAPRPRHAPRETDMHRKHRHEALNAPALGWAAEILQAQVVEVKLNN